MGLRNILSTIKQTRQLRKVVAPMAEILDTLEGVDCYVERNGNRWKIIVNGDNALPAGGTKYQVLQRNASIVAVWDYVRWP